MTTTRRRRVDVTTADDSAPRRTRRDVDTEGHPAQVVLRRPRLAALRRHHPPARVLPDSLRAGDPRRARRRDRRGHARRHARRARFRHVRQDADPARRAPRRRHAHAVRAVRRQRADACATRPPRSTSEYPASHVHAVVGDFEHHLGTHPAAAAGASWRSSAARSATCCRRTAREFLRDIADGPRARRSSACSALDLVKDVDRLEAAYDDAQGVTAEFNKNVLHVMNRELDADFDLDAFEHVAVFDTDDDVDRDAAARRSTTHTVHVARARARRAVRGRRGDAHRGEREVHARAGRRRELAARRAASSRDWWTDPDGDFALLLARSA